MLSGHELELHAAVMLEGLGGSIAEHDEGEEPGGKLNGVVLRTFVT